LTHDDLKRTTRIRATLDLLAKAFASERKLLEGKRIDAAVKRQRPQRKS
jgi:hypothetical protein